MDGLELAEKIMQIRPSIAVLLYGVDVEAPDHHEIETKARALGVRCVVRYPCAEKDFANALETALKGSLFSKPAFQVFGGTSGDFVAPAARRRQSVPTERGAVKNRILLADSSPFLQKMMSDVLGREGYEIIGNAKTAEECLEMVWEHRPDMVILDFMEEKDHRLGFITRIHAIDSDVPIVLRIDKKKYPDIKEMTERGIRAGAAGVFFSPFVNERLLEEVKRVLG